jgi:hypothetical protein
MFGSTVLDVAVGLVFTFLTVSLVCGLLTETWATIMSWRANTLLTGVQALVNDPGFTKLARTLYQHGLVSAQDSGTAEIVADLKKLPSYIAPLQFADALLDTVQIGADTTAASMKTAIVGSPLLAGNTQMTTMLNGMADRAGGDVGKMRQAIAAWFDSSMDRVSGSYKRWTQLYCFGFGLIIAVVLNIDTLHVARALWLQPQITHAIGASLDPAKAMSTLGSMGLPIGWGGEAQDYGFTACSARLLGWIITAFSTLFGATFWFDALSGLVKLRGVGPSPDDRAQNSPAAGTVSPPSAPTT